eukprot:gene13157-9198_t
MSNQGSPFQTPDSTPRKDEQIEIMEENYDDAYQESSFNNSTSKPEEFNEEQSQTEL